MPGAPAFHFNLGTAPRTAGDLQGAVGAYLAAFRLNPKDGRLALFAGAALEAAGRREDAAILFSLGDDVDPAVRRAKDRADLDPEIRRRSAIADRVMREHFTRLHAACRRGLRARAAASGGGAPPDVSRVRGAIWIQTHDRPGRLPHAGPAAEPFLHAGPAGDADHAARAVALGGGHRGEDGRSARRNISPPSRPARRTRRTSTRQRVRRSGASCAGTSDWSSLHLYKVDGGDAVRPAFPENAGGARGRRHRARRGPAGGALLLRLKPGAHIPPHFGDREQPDHDPPAAHRAGRLRDPRRRRARTPGAKASSSPSTTASSTKPGIARPRIASC